MPNEQTKAKLLILAKAVKQGDLTFLESYNVKEAFEKSTRGTVKGKVVESIAKGLNAPEEQVLVKLAASDNTDRIIDDITNILDGKDG